MKNRLQSRFAQSQFTHVDITALLVFVTVWIYFIWTVKYGFCPADESYPVTVAQRLAHGDRLIVDEWPPGQLSCFWIWAPYRIYMMINGTSDGIILFLRYLFLVFNAVFYWVMYSRLRIYRWTALIATLLFSLSIPMLLFCFTYYTVPARLLMIVCLILFAEKQTPASLFLAGILFSCSVLNQPGFAFLYFSFTVLVWIRFFRVKKGKWFLDDFSFCLHIRVWKYISVGVLFCAAAFLGWQLIQSGLRDILTSLPCMLTNPDLDYSLQGDMTLIFFNKMGEVIKIYGLVCLLPALIIVLLAIAYSRGFFRKNPRAARIVLFFFACVTWILSCAQSVRIYDLSHPDVFFSVYPAPMLWLGLVCFLLSSRRNKRLLLFWVVGLFSSLCVDFSSHSTLSLGCPIAYIADLVFFVDLVRELHAERPEKKVTSLTQLQKRKKNKRLLLYVRLLTCLTCCIFTAWTAFVLIFSSPAFPEHLLLGTSLYSLPYICTRGPWRSLHVSQIAGEDYNRQLADIDTLKKKQPKNLCVCGLSPELYLYADLPYATYHSMLFCTTPYVNRLVLYWKMHPDRQPECIYFPIDRSNTTLYSNTNAASALRSNIHVLFDPLCEYTAVQGQGGYILYITQWHLDAETTK